MRPIEPQIVQRFPRNRERILRACFRDAAVAELCRDYDTLAEALIAEEGRRTADGLSNAPNSELLDLMADLEKELLDRLERLHTIRQAN